VIVEKASLNGFLSVLELWSKSLRWIEDGHGEGVELGELLMQADRDGSHGGVATKKRVQFHSQSSRFKLLVAHQLWLVCGKTMGSSLS